MFKTKLTAATGFDSQLSDLELIMQNISEDKNAESERAKLIVNLKKGNAIAKHLLAQQKEGVRKLYADNQAIRPDNQAAQNRQYVIELLYDLFFACPPFRPTACRNLPTVYRHLSTWSAAAKGGKYVRW